MSQQNKNTTQITRKLFEAKKKKEKKKKHYLTQYQRQSKRNYRKHKTFFKRQHSFIRRKKNRGIFKLLLRKSRKCTPIHRWLGLLYSNSLQHLVDSHKLPHSTLFTAWRSNIESDEFVDSKSLLCKYINYKICLLRFVV